MLPTSESKAPRKLAIAGFAVLIWLVVIASELMMIRALSAATSCAAPSAGAVSQEKSAWKA